MARRFRQIITWMIGAALIGAAFLLGAVSSASAKTLGWVAVASLSGESLSAAVDGKLFVSNKGTLSLPGETECRSRPRTEKRVDWFETSFGGLKRTLSLQCGSAATHGYLHIAEGKSDHQSGWRKRLAMADPLAKTDSWDELMWWSAIQTWMSPEKSIILGDGKICRSGPVSVYGHTASGSRYLKFTFRPTFIWSLTNNRLITAIPSTRPTC